MPKVKFKKNIWMELNQFFYPSRAKITEISDRGFVLLTPDAVDALNKTMAVRLILSRLAMGKYIVCFDNDTIIEPRISGWAFVVSHADHDDTFYFSDNVQVHALREKFTKHLEYNRAKGAVRNEK